MTDLGNLYESREGDRGHNKWRISRLTLPLYNLHVFYGVITFTSFCMTSYTSDFSKELGK